MEKIAPVLKSRAMALVAGCILAFTALHASAQSLREVLGPGDSVRITVLRYPDLTTEGRLGEQGRITLPLVGEVRLNGMTPHDAGKYIAGRYRQGKFLVNPQVNVTILETRSRQVSVLGLVGKPGRYPLEGTSAKLTDMIAMAGGLQPTASDIVTVVTTRNGKQSRIEVDLSELMNGGGKAKNIEVRNGDTIFVNRAPVFYIYGEVQRAGAYRVEPGLTVVQAISLAGGLTVRGTDSRPRLKRKVDGKWTEKTAQLFDTVQADDVIYIRESLF